MAQFSDNKFDQKKAYAPQEADGNSFVSSQLLSGGKWELISLSSLTMGAKLNCFTLSMDIPGFPKSEALPQACSRQ
jgi:hypothetical protein